MPVASAGGREYVGVVGDYTCAVYTRPLRLKSEAFQAVEVVAEGESGKRIWEIP